jgi:hypothetical protein
MVSNFRDHTNSKLGGVTESQKDENITFQDYNSSKFTTNQSVNRQNVFLNNNGPFQNGEEMNPRLSSIHKNNVNIKQKDHTPSSELSFHEANYPNEEIV